MAAVDCELNSDSRWNRVHAKQRGLVRAILSNSWSACKVGSLDDAYEPLLKEEDAQYGFDSERGTATLGATRRGIRGHQRHQFRPGHHQAHLVQKLALSRPLGPALESSCGTVQAHLFHGFSEARPVPSDGFCRLFLTNSKFSGKRSRSRTNSFFDKNKPNIIYHSNILII